MSQCEDLMDKLRDDHGHVPIGLCCLSDGVLFPFLLPHTKVIYVEFEFVYCVVDMSSR